MVNMHGVSMLWSHNSGYAVAVQERVSFFFLTEKKYFFGSFSFTVVDPKVGARTQEGLGSGAIAGIVVAVILIVLITIDLFCCFFNSCGIIFCCHQAFCGGGGSDKGVKSGKDDCKY